jgi:hypothetical protein
MLPPILADVEDKAELAGFEIREKDDKGRSVS